MGADSPGNPWIPFVDTREKYSATVPEEHVRKPKNDTLQGTLAMLVLKTLAVHGRLHGYAMTARIQLASADLLRVEEGSLYPALHRMEQEGLLEAEWDMTEKNRQARFYRLTAAGRGRLSAEEAKWEQLTEGVRLVLQQA